MTDTKDNGRKALEILRSLYAGSSKHRVITLYNQLTTLQKGESETITDYIIRAESTTTALKQAKEVIRDLLLMAMTLKRFTQ